MNDVIQLQREGNRKMGIDVFGKQPSENSSFVLTVTKAETTGKVIELRAAK